MEKLKLDSQKRENSGVKPKNILKTGMMPAVLYGHNVSNMSLLIKASDFSKVLKKAGESTIIELTTDDNKVHNVLIHDVQNHYLTGVPIHVDFYEVNMTEKLRSMIALEFTGEASAVKTLGGILVKLMSEIEVECLPADLPHSIKVDISGLTELTSHLQVKDLQIDSKVKILTNANDLIVKIQPPRDIEAEMAKETVDEKTAVDAAVAASEKPKTEGEKTETGDNIAKGKAEKEKPKKE